MENPLMDNEPTPESMKIQEISFDSDPDLTEIINQGKLYLFPIVGSTLELEQLIHRLLDEQH